MKPLILLCVAVLAGCAQAPESIAPSYVPDVMFRSLSCQDLAGEQARVAVALTAASEQQNQARSNDIAGVFWLGMPMGSMSGQNVAPNIAQLKGTQEALTRSATRLGCGAS